MTRYLVTVTEQYEVEADDEGHAMFLADWPHRDKQVLHTRDYDVQPFPDAMVDSEDYDGESDG
jgi:hypothetical protein